MRIRFLAGFFTLVLAGQALGQARTIELVVTTSNGATVVAPAQATETLATPYTRAASEGLLLKIRCTASHDCQRVAAVLVVDAIASVVVVNANPGASATNAEISIAPNHLPTDKVGVIRIRLGADMLEPEIRTEVRQQQREEGPVIGSFSFACDNGFSVSTSPAFRNLKTFVVNSAGNVISRPATRVDADDRIIVYTLGPGDDAGRIRIRRISEFGAPGQIDILGAGASTDLVRQAGGLCAANYAVLGDFSAGKGEVEIARIDDTGTAKILSTFDFGVDHLYSGAFSFGPVITGLEDRDYAVAGDTTIYESRNYENGGRYTLAYTHFIYGRRNLDSPGLDQRPQLNPFIAIGTKDVFENVMGGVALDLFGGSAYVLLGGHGGRVNTLITSDSVAIGRKWRVGAGALPIRREWDWAWFGGLTVDLRAAVQLFGKIIRPAPGG